MEIIRKVFQKYTNKSLLKENYKIVNNKPIDMIGALEKEINTLNMQENTINDRLDRLYDDKLKGSLLEIDFIRISEKYIKERKRIEEKMKNLISQLQSIKRGKNVQSKNDKNKISKLISEFLELKGISKSFLFRLIEKIEIDKDKKVFISFNFASPNTTCDNTDEFIEIEKIFQENNRGVH